MKKISLLLTALFALSAGSLFAQTTANINAVAEIAAAIEVDNVVPVDFGLLSGDSDAYLSTGTVGEVVSSGIISGQSIGSFNLTGGADVTLAWNNGTLAKTDDSAETMSFVPFLSFDDDGTQTGIAQTSTTINLSGTPTVISVGGELQNVEGKPSGNYTTDTAGGNAVEVTITYVTI